MDTFGYTNRIFWVFEGAMDEWAKCSVPNHCSAAGNVVIYDTTHGTNHARMKLGLFVTVGAEGNSIILAGSLLQDETWEMFYWAFSKFADAFIVGPTAIFTDEDTAMEKALNELSGTGNGDAESHPFWDGSWGTEPLPPTKHLLCIFHISKNLYKHLRTLFVSQMEVRGRGQGGRARVPQIE